MGRKPKYEDPIQFKFVCERELWERFIKDGENEGYDDTTSYLQKVIKTVLGDE